MSRSISLFAVSGILLLVPQVADAQVARAGLVPDTQAQRYGLQRSWFTRVQVDSARNQVEHLTQHVSSTQGFTAHEVEYDGGQRTFTENDLDEFGDPLGKTRAEELANDLFRTMELSKRNPKLTTRVIPDVTLYAVTSAAVVQAIDAQTGRSKWVTRIGNPRFVTDAAGMNDDYVGVVNGTTLYALKADNGQVAWRRNTMGAPGAGPALSDRYAFVPMLSGMIEAYQLEDHRQPPWVYRSHGRVIVQPIYTGFNVAWPTDRGFMYVAQGSNAEIRYRLETNDSIVAPAAWMPPNYIVVASTDGYAYCVHEQSGSIVWRFSTGERLINAPFIVDQAVYLVTEIGTLFRLDGLTGIDKWSVSGIGSILSASEDRLYCVSTTGRLMIINPESGSTIGSLATETLDLRLQNRLTDRVIIGTRNGLIQCLHERANRWPVIHQGAHEANKAEDAGADPAAAPAADTKPAEPASPFGGDTNPFGGSASPFGGSDPFGSGAGAGAGGSDPFGSASPFGSGDAGASGGSPFDDPFGGTP